MPRQSNGAAEYGIPVQSAKEIVRPCLREMRAVLGLEDLSFQGAAPERGESEIVLASSSPTSGFADRPYPVVPFVGRKAFSYWLALALKFQRDASLLLTSASIMVFEGPASDPQKVPLLRAEWHEWDKPGVHAQPHWHVYASALAEMAQIFPEGFAPEEAPVLEFGSETAEPRDFDEDAFEAVAATQPSPSMRLAEFHYAMSARWHVADGCQERLSSTAVLTNWLGGCIRYTREQLTYISR